MILDMKEKGQPNQYNTRLGLASYFCWRGARRVMGLTVNQRLPMFEHGDGGSNPPLSASMKNAPSVVRATSGAILWPKPQDGVSTPTVIVALSLEESKGKNDVPQLRNGDGESREVRQEGDSAISMQEVWEAFQ